MSESEQVPSPLYHVVRFSVSDCQTPPLAGAIVVSDQVAEKRGWVDGRWQQIAPACVLAERSPLLLQRLQSLPGYAMLPIDDVYDWFANDERLNAVPDSLLPYKSLLNPRYEAYHDYISSASRKRLVSVLPVPVEALTECDSSLHIALPVAYVGVNAAAVFPSDLRTKGIVAPLAMKMLQTFGSIPVSGSHSLPSREILASLGLVVRTKPLSSGLLVLAWDRKRASALLEKQRNKAKKALVACEFPLGEWQRLVRCFSSEIDGVPGIRSEFCSMATRRGWRRGVSESQAIRNVRHSLVNYGKAIHRLRLRSSLRNRLASEGLASLWRPRIRYLLASSNSIDQAVGTVLTSIMRPRRPAKVPSRSTPTSPQPQPQPQPQ